MVVEMLAEVATISGLILALVIFSTLTIRSRKRSPVFGSLKFGISMATFVWVAGEAVSLLERYGVSGLGLVVHTVAMAIFVSVVLWRARIFLR